MWGEVHDENTAGMGGISSHAGLFGTAHDLCKLGNTWRVTLPTLLIASVYMNDGENFLTPDLVQQSRKEFVRASDGTRYKK